MTVWLTAQFYLLPGRRKSREVLCNIFSLWKTHIQKDTRHLFTFDLSTRFALLNWLYWLEMELSICINELLSCDWCCVICMLELSHVIQWEQSQGAATERWCSCNWQDMPIKTYPLSIVKWGFVFSLIPVSDYGCELFSSQCGFMGRVLQNILASAIGICS